MTTSPLSARVQAQLLDERAYTAARLHDEVGQSLSAALISLEFAGADGPDPEVLAETIADIRRALTEVRELSLMLARPPDDHDPHAP